MHVAVEQMHYGRSEYRVCGFTACGVMGWFEAGEGIKWWLDVRKEDPEKSLRDIMTRGIPS